MSRKSFWPGIAALSAAGLFVAALGAPVPAQDIAAPPGGDAADGQGEGYEALTRGPMHEAFANPYATNPEPGIIVEQQPPEPIDEVPPDQRPGGDDVVWIPGYWGWDPDGDEFIWISGLWRTVPADRRWVPGYWAEIEGGFQWVAGFWTGGEVTQLTYLPEPPESLERGPNVAAPDGDYFWIPGCWTWQEVQYEWRPGYWAPAVADWVWIPDQYVWSPYGCVFVPGYWDYTFVDRGVMFAPVHFDQVVYTQPSFRYVPTVVIDTAPLLMHLFVSPTYSHYFYGDYYAFQPARPGFAFQPWVAYDRRPNLYDPLLTYYQWSYGQRDVDIVQRLTVWNQYFVRNEAYRPPRTFRQQREFLAQNRGADLPVQTASLAFASPLREFAESRADRVRFATVDEPARERFTERARGIREFQTRRSEFEVAAAAQAPPPEQAQPGQPAAERPRPTQTLELPEATAVAPAVPPRAAAGRDASPGDRAPGEAAGENPDARPETPPPPRPGDTPPADAARPEAGDAPDADGTSTADDRPGRTDRPGRDDRPGREDQPERTRPREERGQGDAPASDAPATDAPDSDLPGDADRPRTDTNIPANDPADPRSDRPRGDSPPGLRPDRPGRPGDDPTANDPERNTEPGSAPAEPADEPNRPRGDRPGRPDEAPDTPAIPGLNPDGSPAAPGNADRPERTDRGRNDQNLLPPGRDRRPDGADGPGVPTQPGAGRPDVPGTEGPGADPTDPDAGPRFPRFGNGPNRGARTGETPTTPPGPGGNPGAGRGRSRDSFDPFGGLPPNADAATPGGDARDSLPSTGRRPGRGSLGQDNIGPGGPPSPGGRQPGGRDRRPAIPDGPPGPGGAVPPDGGLSPAQPRGAAPGLDRPGRGRPSGGPPAGGAAVPGAGRPSAPEGAGGSGGPPAGRPGRGAGRARGGAPAGPPSGPAAPPAAPPGTPGV